MVIREVETLIVGGGILGSGTAYYLARAGRADTVVVESGRPGGEASDYTAGGLGIQNKPANLIKATLASFELWAGLSDELGTDIDYRRTGGLNVASNESDLERLQLVAAAQQAEGAEITMLTIAQARELVPGLSPKLAAAAFCPDDGFAPPRLPVLAYIEAARRLGVDYWEGTEVRSLCRDQDGILVDTDRGAVRAAKLLNAAGAWGQVVGAMLGTTFRITPIVGTRIMLPLLDTKLPHLVNHVRGNLSLKRSTDTQLMVGGGWLGRGDHATRARESIAENVEGNLRMAYEVLPELAGRTPLEVSVGWDSYLPDHLPLCGAWPGIEHAYVVHGTRRAYSLGPLLAKMTAELMLGQLSPQYTDFAYMFNPAREMPEKSDRHL